MVLYDAHTHCNNINNPNIISVFNIIADAHNTPSLSKGKYFSIGIHPWYLSDWELALKQLQKIAIRKEIVAIGECGLDFNNATNKEIQKEVFIKQVRLSEKIRKPMLIHSVRTYADILSIRKEKKVKQKWLFHAYNSSWQMTEQLLNNNCYFSFGEMSLKESKNITEVIKKIPLTRMLIETDENENCLLQVYQKISEIRKIGIEQLISIQKDNFKDFYEIIDNND